MAPITLNDLVAAVAGQYAEYCSGTIDSSTTNTITDAELIASRRSLKGHQLVVSGVPIGRITAFNDATGLVTFAPTAGAAPTGSYEVFPIPRQEIVRSINRAIDTAGHDFMVSKTIEQPWSGQYEYPLPDDFVAMLAVNVVSIDAVGRRSLSPLSHFEIGANQDNRTLIMRDGQPYYTDSPLVTLMQFTYLSLPRHVTNGSDTLQVDDNTGARVGVDSPVLVEFLTEMALHYLHERDAQRNPGQPESTMHYTAARDHKQKAEAARKRADQPRVQRRVRRAPQNKQR